MALSEQQIIGKLKQYGHLESPFGQPSQLWPSTAELTLESAEVLAAVASFQAFNASSLEPLVSKHHPERQSAAVIPDGIVGPATEELFETARCDVPDFAFPEPLVGQGNWKRCWGVGEFHRCKVKVNHGQVPAFLKPHWGEVKARVKAAYSEVGLDFVFEDELTNYNTSISFVKPDGGWIGLAIVGSGLGCSDTIWARFDRNYQPQNIITEWTTLLAHELGHNAGLSHSSGGKMNSYILKGLPVSWKNDPSWPLLKSRFGGVPVPGSVPMERERWLAWKYKDGRYEDIMELPPGGGLFPIT